MRGQFALERGRSREDRPLSDSINYSLRDDHPIPARAYSRDGGRIAIPNHALHRINELVNHAIRVSSSSFYQKNAVQRPLDEMLVTTRGGQPPSSWINESRLSPNG